MMRNSTLTAFTWCKWCFTRLKRSLLRESPTSQIKNLKRVANPRVQRVNLFYRLKSRQNRKKDVFQITAETQFKLLSESVTPLADIPYEDQLTMKADMMRHSLRKVLAIAINNKSSPCSQLQRQADQYDGLICPFTDIKPSPDIMGYRNKLLLNIGPGVDGNEKTVGMFVGKWRYGVVSVNLDHVINVSPKHKEMVHVYQDFIRHYAAPSGEWRPATVRSTQTGDTMLSIRFNPHDKSEDAVERAKEDVCAYFVNGPGKVCGITSLYLQVGIYESAAGNYHLLDGQPYIYEMVLGHKFRISPSSFFQTNTPGAEVLYRTARELVGLDSGITDRASQNVTVFDCCCGTGTIGILMSQGARHVIGVDIVKQAIDDALVNAQINNIDNAEFLHGRVSAVMKQFLAEDRFTDDDCVVAMVNPGRSGLARKMIHRLRVCSPIKKLVFISCKPHGNILHNFTDLCLDEGEDTPGQPFLPVKATAVDMFPHTLHTELLLLFER